MRKAPLRAIVHGGLACGALDITAAFVVYGQFGATPAGILRGIAAGLLGPEARAGGWPVAALGLGLHFLIALGAAAVYVGAWELAERWSGLRGLGWLRWLRWLVRRPLAAGPLYGVAVYFFMQRVVVPLSAARRAPFSLKFMIIGIVIHVFCVGLPIAFAARRQLAS
jgi:hypothetical protein